MTWKLLFILLMITSLTSCSNKDNKNEVGEEQAQVEEASDELLENEEIDADIALEDTDEELILDDESEMGVAKKEEPMIVDDNLLSESEFSDTPSSANTAAAVAIDNSQVKSYVVQANDTLMLISWKIYGDYAKWRSIARLNSGSLGSNNSLAVGQSIRYYAPAEEFTWNPEGNPYLILRGDSLGRISNKVYGTKAKWKSIWTNNRPMIKDPNLIFAGFTIYTLDADVAMNK